jgi:hypothetical protein
VSVRVGVFFQNVFPPVIVSLYTSTRTHSSPVVSLAFAISSFSMAPTGSHACIWLIGSASDACYCSGSPICSYRECSGVLFRRFRVSDSIDVKQVGPLQLRLLDSSYFYFGEYIER